MKSYQVSVSALRHEFGSIYIDVDEDMGETLEAKIKEITSEEVINALCDKGDHCPGSTYIASAEEVNTQEWIDFDVQPSDEVYEFVVEHKGWKDKANEALAWQKHLVDAFQETNFVAVTMKLTRMVKMLREKDPELVKAISDIIWNSPLGKQGSSHRAQLITEVLCTLIGVEVKDPI